MQKRRDSFWEVFGRGALSDKPSGVQRQSQQSGPLILGQWAHYGLRKASRDASMGKAGQGWADLVFRIPDVPGRSPPTVCLRRVHPPPQRLPQFLQVPD